MTEKIELMIAKMREELSIDDKHWDEYLAIFYALAEKESAEKSSFTHT